MSQGRKTRKQRQRQRQRQSRQKQTLHRGGATVGEGAHGVVYRPPLACNSSTPLPPELMTNAYVGKYVSAKNAQIEKTLSNKVKAINTESRYTVPIDAVCKIAETQPNTSFQSSKNRNTQVISKYSGFSVESLIPSIEVLNEPELYSKQMTPEAITVLFEGLKAIKALMPSLREFNEYYIHQDLHFGNIVWDGEHAKLIDFTEMEPISEVADRNREMYPGKSEEWLLEQVKSIDVSRLYDMVREIILSKFIQENFRDKFRIWQFLSPQIPRNRDSMYSRLEALPV